MHPGQGTEEGRSSGLGLPHAEVRDHLLPFQAPLGQEGAGHSPPSAALDGPQEVGFKPWGKAGGLGGAFLGRQGW